MWSFFTIVRLPELGRFAKINNNHKALDENKFSKK